MILFYFTPPPPLNNRVSHQFLTTKWLGRADFRLSFGAMGRRDFYLSQSTLDGFQCNLEPGFICKINPDFLIQVCVAVYCIKMFLKSSPKRLYRFLPNSDSQWISRQLLKSMQLGLYDPQFLFRFYLHLTVRVTLDNLNSDFCIG